MKYENILSYIDEYSIVSNDTEARFNCPFCGESRKRLYLNLETGKYHCHNCNASGKSPIRLIQQLTGYSVDEIRKEWKDILTVEIVPSEKIVDKVMEELFLTDEIEFNKKGISLPRGYYPLSSKDMNSKSKKAIKYLKRRGISMAQIEMCGMGLCEDPKYANRVIIPITNTEDEVVFFVARDFTGKSNLKELSPRNDYNENSKSEVMFNLGLALETRELILSEGIFDALSWGESGVALLGKSFSSEQLIQLYNHKDSIDRIYVALDEDAKDYSAELCYRLKSMGFEVYFIPFEGDPNDNLQKHGRKHMRNLIANAIKYENRLSML